MTSSSDDPELDSLLHKVARTDKLTPSRELPKPGMVIAEKYKIETLLGRGGMGAVFSARHELTGKLFAIKWLLPDLSNRPDAVQRFLREARVGGQVAHLNVVEVYDVGQDGDSYYMVMELIHGETLSRRLARIGPFSSTQACRTLIPVMRGLDAVHRAGVVHRDLKPQNIILSRSELGELPMVLDFGISKVIPVTDGSASHADTHSGMLMIGTPYYMAPEQLRSAAVDARADVYALGVIMYQLLCGKLPFWAENYPDLVLKVLGETPQPLNERVPGTPVELAQAISKAMARDPKDRFASVEAFARALEPFADGMQFSPGSLPDVEPVLSRSDRVETSQPTLLATESMFMDSRSLRGASRRGWSARRHVIVGAGVGIALAVVALGYLQPGLNRSEPKPDRAGPESESHAVSQATGAPTPQPSAAGGGALLGGSQERPGAAPSGEAARANEPARSRAAIAQTGRGPGQSPEPGRNSDEARPPELERATGAPSDGARPNGTRVGGNNAAGSKHRRGADLPPLAPAAPRRSKNSAPEERKTGDKAPRIDRRDFD